MFAEPKAENSIIYRKTHVYTWLNFAHHVSHSMQKKKIMYVHALFNLIFFRCQLTPIGFKHRFIALNNNLF